MLELGQGHPAGALQLDDAEGAQQLLDVVEPVGRAVEADRQLVVADVDDAALEQVHQLDDGAAGRHVGPQGHEHELALDRVAGVELADLHHVDQLVELLGDLLERGRLDVDHDRDAAEPVVLGGGDGQREDVEAAPGEQAGHAGQHAGLVLDQHDQRVVAGIDAGNELPFSVLPRPATGR